MSYRIWNSIADFEIKVVDNSFNSIKKISSYTHIQNNNTLEHNLFFNQTQSISFIALTGCFLEVTLLV